MVVYCRSLPVIDSSNNTGSLEFGIPGSPDDFFPINVSFHCTKKSFTDIQVSSIEFSNVLEVVFGVRKSQDGAEKRETCNLCILFGRF